MYFEVKTAQKVGKKFLKNSYLVKADELLAAYTTAGVNLADKEELEFLAAAKKDVIDVFTVEKGGQYFEVKCEYEDVDGKVLKETYIQQALELSDVKGLILGNITGTPEFKSIVEKGYEDYFVQVVE